MLKNRREQKNTGNYLFYELVFGGFFLLTMDNFWETLILNYK